ncbi:MAG: hypothetical protein ACMVP2_03270 [Imperialibacter sp.]|uniref:hypothetical protein n=1 Tax=Imperialibacter sp. TaxID=2038411 RepID=UPI003A8722E2
MDNYFIYQYSVQSSRANDRVLVIFCSGESYDDSYLRIKLRDFFAENIPPKEAFLIIGDYVLPDIKERLESYHGVLFESIPSYLTSAKRLRILYFNANGSLHENGHKIDDKLERDIYQSGLLKIFKDRGGLIESPSETFHYIFPSGKHSSKFIRTGNVLVNSSEIFFIASRLLSFMESTIDVIYCDTSSINSLAFALSELDRRFNPTRSFCTVQSFGSYEKFENHNFSTSDCLILISASTSGNIIRRLIEVHKSLRLDKIAIIFYLSDDLDFMQNVICDLAFESENNPNGISLDTYNAGSDGKCRLCEGGSYTVKVSGDIFLLEKPKVKQISITKSDAPIWLSGFMERYLTQGGKSLIRCFYGDEPYQRTFESYLFLEELSIKGEQLFFYKFNKLLDQYASASLKYLIFLEDSSSDWLAVKAMEFLSRIGKVDVIKISIEELAKNPGAVNNDERGAILIISSCLVSGTSLLYVNKFLRRFDNLTKTYLVGIARTESMEALNFIKKNIGQGEFGVNTNQLEFVETINTSSSNESKEKLVWSSEIDVIRRILDINEEEFHSSIATEYFSKRLEDLESAQADRNKGLVNNVFLVNPITNLPLKINKNFAFYNFNDYHDKVSQADIFFTVSCILNNLRCLDGTHKRSIVQEEQVRTVLSPNNFQRFDDGIIQGSLLRAATSQELNYSFDSSISEEFKETFLKIIDNYEDDIVSEGFAEFLLAMSIKKIRCRPNDMVEIMDRLNKKVKNDVLRLFAKYIGLNVVNK